MADDGWSVAHQELGLARCGSSGLAQALHFIDVARRGGARNRAPLRSIERVEASSEGPMGPGLDGEQGDERVRDSQQVISEAQ
ncbi:hypothetical protein [Streptomyces formicae]|uniref:hypothetical protein n=1 Tax=Streptomyces formicae TaxID=1616117 RepID=UPI000BF9E22B|nr:hypothetical protein [Streptomyces formicae]